VSGSSHTRSLAPVELGALRRCAFVVLVHCLSCLAANAIQGNTHKLTANPGEPCCQITSINTASGVVSARDNSTGQSFRFFVKDSVLITSLKEGQAIFADFKTQQVFTRGGANGQSVRLGGILGGAYGQGGGTNLGPVDGAHPVGPIDGARPLGPIDGAHPLQPVDGAKPLGPVDGARPVGPIDGVRPVGPIDGAKPLGPVDGAKPAGPIDGVRPLGPVDGAHLGNAANPGEPCCAITSLNPVTGIVRAKNLSSGQAFQFTVKDSALFRSFNVGQRFFANFNSHQLSLDGKAFTGMQSFSFF